MSKPVKVDPFLIDEPSIAPPSPSDALFRLIQLEGALQGLMGKANPVPSVLEDAKAGIGEARDGLIRVFSQGINAGAALETAQNQIRALYAALQAEFSDLNEAAPLFQALGFPHPVRNIDTWVSPVDLSTITVTHYKPENQVMTTISFEHAFGAEAYWLREIIFFADQEEESNVVQNFAPIFQRVRMPIGKHTLFIESRNHHRAVLTGRFEIEVPAL